MAPSEKLEEGEVNIGNNLRRSRGDNSTLFTEPKENKCLNIVTHFRVLVCLCIKMHFSYENEFDL